MLRLLVWNIRQGGGTRRERIAAYLHHHNPDIVALIEFVPKTAAAWVQSFHEMGFAHRICSTPDGFNHAICVLSKTPIGSVSFGIPPLDESGLWLAVGVPAQRFSFGVVHAPTQPRTRMRNFLSALVRVAELSARQPFIFVGDFNTGIGPEDGPLQNFGDVDRFIALQQAGFTDAWRHMHGGIAEYTYTFPRTGKSYRIDHALASLRMLPRIRDCRYSHLERHSGASDHSALVIEIGD